jgi:glucose/arabinose dehydrogenase
MLAGPRISSPLAAAALALAVLSVTPLADAGPLPLDRIRLPPGFAISVFVDNVPGARSLALSPGGTLFIGTMGQGVVYAVSGAGRGDRVDRVRVIARGLSLPNGVAFRDGSLYVAEVNRVIRFDAIETRLDAPPAPVVVSDAFPRDRHHGWKFIRFGPDGMLYVPVGGPCNVCEPPGPLHATITRIRPDGSGLEVFARGIRNSVGFDWHPVTGELWFTDNGRDWLGDDRPPDELNHAPRSGLHFGFPYCFGRAIADPDFGAKRRCDEFTPPAVELGPHVASLGMRFYTGEMFPAAYRNQILIPEHGSWNRSQPLGYRLTLVRLAPNQPPHYEVFAEGWLEGGRAWGRPVDLQVMPDGALLVSDDRAGVVYRITYSSPK